MRHNKRIFGKVVLPTPFSTIKDQSTNINSAIIESASGVWTTQDVLASKKVDAFTSWDFIPNSVPGLAYNFFSGSAWRSVIATGNIGSIPVGSLVATSINYGTRGDNYGLLAIGYFRPPTTGTYSFWTSSDDGSGVWIGDVALLDGVRNATNAVVNNGLGLGQGNTKRGGSVALTGGIWYPIRIVHEEGTGGDNCTFSWAGPGIGETVDLSTYFRTEAVNGVSTGKFVNLKF